MVLNYKRRGMAQVREEYQILVMHKWQLMKRQKSTLLPYMGAWMWSKSTDVEENAKLTLLMSQFVCHNVQLRHARSSMCLWTHTILLQLRSKLSEGIETYYFWIVDRPPTMDELKKELEKAVTQSDWIQDHPQWRKIISITYTTCHSWHEDTESDKDKGLRLFTSALNENYVVHVGKAMKMT